MKIKKLISGLLLIGVMVGLYAAEVTKITEPAQLKSVKPKLNVGVGQITCKNKVCRFNFKGHQFEDHSDFSWLDLTGADFSGAALKNANFMGTILKDANFSNTDINTDLEGATFKGADITGARFNGVKNVDLTGSIGSPASLPLATSSVPVQHQLLVSTITTPTSSQPIPTEQQVTVAPRPPTPPVAQPTPPAPIPSVAPQVQRPGLPGMPQTR